MSVMIPESVWNTVGGAVLKWREDYDETHLRIFGPDKPIVPPEGLNAVFKHLFAASELLRNPPREESTRDALSAGEKTPRKGVQLYKQGVSFERIVLEIRKRNLNGAAHFLQNDLAAGSNGETVKVDPYSMRETDRGVEYTLVAPPDMPTTPAQAVQFFLDYGNIKGFPGDPSEVNRVLATRPSAGSIRMATMIAMQSGHFAQANRAALLLANQFGYDSSDVNPHPDASASPWVDVLV